MTLWRLKGMHSGSDALLIRLLGCDSINYLKSEEIRINQTD